jgi:hypothetical protein
MRQYTEQDLEHCEQLIAEARIRVARQQVIIEQLTSFDRFDDACSVLDSLQETLVLYEIQHVQILRALSK